MTLFKNMVMKSFDKHAKDTFDASTKVKNNFSDFVSIVKPKP